MLAINSPRDWARLIVLSAAVVCLGTTAGCYRYAPVQVTELAPAMSVRMELSAVAVERLRKTPDSLAKLLDGFRVNGTVSRLVADSVLLAVPTSYMEANVRLKTQLHDLPLFRSDVQRVEWRRLDKLRTTWVGVALGVAGVVSTVYVLNRRSRSAGTVPRPSDPTESRVGMSVGWPGWVNQR